MGEIKRANTVKRIDSFGGHHMKFNKKETDQLAVQIRKNILRAIASKGRGHVGGSLSIADTLAVLYQNIMNIDPSDPKKEDRDYIVM